MARPQKKGFDYFNLDTDHFQDLKVKQLKRKFGCEGYCVYQYLLNEIYREAGYYISYDEDLVFDVSDFWSIGEDTVDDIDDYCCKVGLFDGAMYEEQDILTSHSIQSRYAEMSRGTRRKDWAIKSEYNLLDEKEVEIITEETPRNDTTNRVNVRIGGVIAEETPVITEETPRIPAISTQRKEKKTKEKPPKGGKKKGELSFPPSLPEIEAYVTEQGLAMAASEFFDYNEAKGWDGVRDWKAAVRRWASKEGAFGQKPRPRSKDPTTATWSLPERAAPKRDVAKEFRERLAGYIEGYKSGSRSPSIVETLRTAKRNGNLAKCGLEWEETEN